MLFYIITLVSYRELEGDTRREREKLRERIFAIFSVSRLFCKLLFRSLWRHLSLESRLQRGVDFVKSIKAQSAVVLWVSSLPHILLHTHTTSCALPPIHSKPKWKEKEGAHLSCECWRYKTKIWDCLHEAVYTGLVCWPKHQKLQESGYWKNASKQLSMLPH